MDKPRIASWRARLLAALARLLPPSLGDHPDAAPLFEPAGDLPDTHLDEAPLATLAHALALAPVEHLALALAWWSDIDPRIGALLGLMQATCTQPGTTRPTLGLVLQLGSLPALGAPAGGAPRGPVLLGQLLQGAAIGSGLLRLGEAAVLHQRPLQLPLALLGLLACEHPPADVGLGRTRLRRLDVPLWPLPAAWTAGLQKLADVALREPAVLVLRGADADELRAAAAWLAARCERRAWELSGDAEASASPDAPGQLAARAGAEGASPALVALNALPVWQARALPGQALRAPRLSHWPGPCIVLAGTEGAVEADARVQEFDLPPPGAADRWALWQALSGGRAGSAAEQALVQRTHCGIGILARGATLASRGMPAAEAIEQAVRAGARGLAAWAQLSAGHVPPEGWVGSPDVQAQLTLLATRCRLRGDAMPALGPLLNGRLGPGVKALFIGASGTGKTLAAQWLADRLARPLLRVDLAAVVSKYIGETEKHLGELLSRAEHLDAVLLFDEADSLFGARTDVKQANDRYANMQTNYLLQRLETFHGVAVLTSNSKARFDDAFLRRLDAVIEFGLPDARERQRLWQLHLGDTPALAGASLDKVAALAHLPGGHIRNVALTAALLALQRQPDAEAPIVADDLRAALALEYRKLGQQPPDGLQAAG